MQAEEGHLLKLSSNQGWDPRIQVAECGDLVRAYLIKTERFLLVYDTLLGPKSGGWLRERALEFGDGKPLLVFNSHADWDHYFGNQVFPEPILGSQECRRRILEGPGPKELAQKRGESEDYAEVELIPPSVTVSDGSILDGGDLTFQVLHTVGHRPDHLALFIPELATLFPGDCVESPIPLLDEDSQQGDQTLSELVASLERMLALEPQWVLANHAAPEAGTGLLESNLQYLHQVTQLAADSKTLEELQERYPAPQGCDGFYVEAHRNTLGFAFEQTRALKSHSL